MRKSRVPSIDEYRNAFNYDPESGIITWKHLGRTRKPGEVGCVNKQGYRMVALYRHHVGAHRVAWLLYYGEWPSSLIDHINGNPSDNRISNLRLASHSLNSANRRKGSGTTSRLKGVTWHKSLGKWQATVQYCRKVYHLGVFSSEQEAHEAYMKKARELFGDFARAA